MAIVEYERNGYLISTNKAKLNLNMIHNYLANTSYWAEGRPVEVVKKSIQNSLCFGVYHRDQQIGFARVITDYATFAWMCDVFILEDFQGRGLGKWLLESVIRHPDLQGMNRIMLATRDAHSLYSTYGGFASLAHPDWIMERVSRHQPGNPESSDLEYDRPANHEELEPYQDPTKDR